MLVLPLALPLNIRVALGKFFNPLCLSFIIVRMTSSLLCLYHSPVLTQSLGFTCCLYNNSQVPVYSLDLSSELQTHLSNGRLFSTWKSNCHPCFKNLSQTKLVVSPFQSPNPAGGSSILSGTPAKNLGVDLESPISLAHVPSANQHISWVYLQNTSRIQPYLTTSLAAVLIRAITCSYLVCCSGLLGGLLRSSLDPTVGGS